MDVIEDVEFKLRYKIAKGFFVKEVILMPFGEKIIKILDKKRKVADWNINHRKEYGE
ncbi:hypothetical protein [Clostridium estertheticum]|uniref:hypothetical protein n=1 Tax=Clostridium estertheticum TaxID=238834 RepID=UPI001CF390F0|nr:hypothetical protein [Clostridium estertheticum]MCB2353005.1 hypothetical protein [Clostridium estertheticum]WAG40305.1 hypothetical protein LL065_18825 [Clostridium estertheticum]